MKDITAWILTLCLLMTGIGLFYYGLYYFFGTIGIFTFIALTTFWLILIRFKK